MSHLLKITTSYLSFLLFLKILLRLNVKNFRESYVFHCLVIKVVCRCPSFATASIIYHISSALSRTFFKFFQTFYSFRSFRSFSGASVPWFCRLCFSDLTTISCCLSSVNSYFYFSEKLLNCLFFRNNYFRQLSYNSTLLHFCQQ